jgi:hypothetical protein
MSTQLVRLNRHLGKLGVKMGSTQFEWTLVLEQMNGGPINLFRPENSLRIRVPKLSVLDTYFCSTGRQV